MPSKFQATQIPDVLLVQPRRFADDRGYFLETYKRSEFVAAGIDCTFVQDNHSLSRAGTVRGLHYQLPPYAQAKLVRVVTGAVWDVAVDIRKSSPTFGHWVAEYLNAENGHMLYIPEGFAHGFVALSDNTHLSYKCSAEYHAAAEAGIRYDDPELALPWPTQSSDGGLLEYLLSEKDSELPIFAAAELFS